MNVHTNFIRWHHSFTTVRSTGSRKQYDITGKEKCALYTWNTHTDTFISRPSNVLTDFVFFSTHWTTRNYSEGKYDHVDNKEETHWIYIAILFYISVVFLFLQTFYFVEYSFVLVYVCLWVCVCGYIICKVFLLLVMQVCHWCCKHNSF